MSDKKLTRVQMEYDDGSVFYHEGEDAKEWDEKVNNAVTFQAIRSGNSDPWGFSPLHKKQKTCQRYDDLKAELNEIWAVLDKIMEGGVGDDWLEELVLAVEERDIEKARKVMNDE